MKVTPQTNLGDLVKTYPQTAPIMLDYGLHCVGCFANQFDTVEMGARVHGMTDEEVGEMIGRLNQTLAETETA